MPRRRLRHLPGTANASFTAGTMTALDFLTGGTAAEARAISPTGLIVGFSRDISSVEQAVTWTGTSATLVANTLGGSGARAFGVSTGGDVAGWARNGSGVQRAFVAVGGAMAALDLTVINPSHDPTLNHNAKALGISPNGRYVVGEYDVDNGLGGTEVRGFVYDRTTPASSYEFSGGGVGSARASNDTHAVGTITNGADALAGFSSHVSASGDFFPQVAGGVGISNAINASGAAAGREDLGAGNRAVAWDSASTLATATNLDALHGTANVLNEATGIADIPGLAVYSGNGTFSGQTHGFFFLIPEPSTLALGGLGSLVLLWKRRRVRARA